MADTAEGGEAMSKNALKKAKKLEELAKAKADKAAKKEAEAAAAPAKAGADETEELDPTKYFENRLQTIIALEVRAFCNPLSKGEFIKLTASFDPAFVYLLVFHPLGKRHYRLSTQVPRFSLAAEFHHSIWCRGGWPNPHRRICFRGGSHP